jgi:acyl-CoA synthetase (AMP-forming)/AMP-acid ligase II
LDKFMVALPVFHSFGLTCGAMRCAISGSRNLAFAFWKVMALPNARR